MPGGRAPPFQELLGEGGGLGILAGGASRLRLAPGSGLSCGWRCGWASFGLLGGGGAVLHFLNDVLAG